MDSDDLNQNRDPESLCDLSASDEPDDEPTKRYTLDLPQSLHKWLKKQAVIEEERSMKEITIEALREYRQSRE
jgi:hypothetical protein